MTAQSTPILTSKTVMARAWAIFRQHYGYKGAGKGLRFAQIGRPGFIWSLRMAWAELREQRRLDAITPDQHARMIEALEFDLMRADAIDNYSRHVAETARINAALQASRTALARLAA
jgi:hypothetical protein